MEIYGKKIIKEYNLINDRKIVFINKEFNEENIKDIIKEIVKDTINFNDYFMYIVKKENKEGFFMKWHVDDAQLIKKKVGYKDQIKVSDKYYLHYNKEVPIYTLIIYESTYNNDFSGGILEFADNIKIKPKKGMYILFNSKEVHRVHKILKGMRINYLIKFYLIKNKL